MTQQLQQAKAQYEADGFYLCDEPLLPADVIARATEGMDAVRAGNYDTGIAPDDSPWNPGDDPNRLCKIEMPQVANRAVFDLVSHSSLGRMAAELTGAQMVQVWWVQLLYKPPSSASAQTHTNIGWHQDREYWNCCWEDESELFTAWVALSDVESASGPMKLLRGSHKWGLLEAGNFEAQDLSSLKQSIQVPDGENWEEVPAILPAGGSSFHHNLTMHGSSENTQDQPRRSFAIHLRTENSRPIEDKRIGLTAFIDDPRYCPVIWGQAP